MSLLKDLDINVGLLSLLFFLKYISSYSFFLKLAYSLIISDLILVILLGDISIFLFGISFSTCCLSFCTSIICLNVFCYCYTFFLCNYNHFCRISLSIVFILRSLSKNKWALGTGLYLLGIYKLFICKIITFNFLCLSQLTIILIFVDEFKK